MTEHEQDAEQVGTPTAARCPSCGRHWHEPADTLPETNEAAQTIALSHQRWCPNCETHPAHANLALKLILKRIRNSQGLKFYSLPARRGFGARLATLRTATTYPHDRSTDLIGHLLSRLVVWIHRGVAYENTSYGMSASGQHFYQGRAACIHDVVAEEADAVLTAMDQMDKMPWKRS